MMHRTELLQQLHRGDSRSIARAVSLVENLHPDSSKLLEGLDRQRIESCLIVGITGPPGAGKSTLTAGLISELRQRGQRVGIVAVDPSSPISGGALLGDRIRMMDHALDREVVVRSMATRGRLGGLCASAGAAVRIMAASGCRTVIIETVGIGQSEMDIIRLADVTVLVLAPGFGDDIQALKAGILEVADLLVVNKSDQDGARKLLLELAAVFASPEDRELRLLQTIASQQQGMDLLAQKILLLADTYRQDGTFRQRRRKSSVLETVDWALELLRPRLTGLAAEGADPVEPRLKAAAILAQLGQELCK